MTRRSMWRASGPVGGADDQRLVRRATVTIAALTAGAVAVVVTAVALLAMLLTIREQRVDAERIVREAATTAEDVTDPPTGVVLLRYRPTTGTQVSAGAPPDLRSIDVPALPPGLSQVSLGHDHAYQLYTHDRDGVRVVAALDLRYRARESTQLLGSLLPAGLVGIAAAAVVGWWVARRAVQPLGAALALQRRFVADASHELRTPLTILHTRAQLLRRRAGPDPRLRDNLDRLIDDTRALTEIVNDLLLSAELQHRPAARERLDLAALARAVTDSFAVTAQRAQVSLSTTAGVDSITSAGTTAAADTTAADTTVADTTVAGVPAALRRAISALVDNALGHNHPGGTITVTVTRHGGTVRLAVVDDGDGLDPSQVADLTQRFARGPDAPGPGRRFGLGLALVREVVHAHGGTLTLDGRPGAGATATITIPAAGTIPGAGALATDGFLRP